MMQQNFRKTFLGMNQDNYQVFLLLFCFIIFELLLASKGSYIWVSKTLIIPVFLTLSFINKEFRLFVRDWAVFLTVLLLFDESRGVVYRIVTYFNLPVYSDYVIRLEQPFVFLFSKTSNQHLSLTLSHILQAGQPIHSFSFLTKLCVAIYGSHFFYFLFVGFTIWHLRPNEFWKFKRAYILCMVMGLIGYLILPTIPPWLASDQGLIAPVSKVISSALNVKAPTLLVLLDLNPIAAMPSIHVAFPTLAALILYFHFGKRTWPAFVYVLVVSFACLLLGAHYVIDLLAGSLLALICFILVYIKEANKSDIKRKETLTMEMFYQIILSLLVFLIVIFVFNLILLKGW